MGKSRTVQVRDVIIGGDQPLILIAGPCVIESEDIVLRTAEGVKKAAEAGGVGVIFKSSYLKANRLSAGSYVGPGLNDGLNVLARVKEEFDLPILTDIHCRTEAIPASQVADIIQIPAFLCRQTELLEAAARTGRPINIKKGQFMAPDDMISLAKKAESVGNHNVVLTERGTFFGYHNLVVDLRSLSIMGQQGHPVVLDVTHSVQLPGSAGGCSGGQREFIFPLARGGVAAGCQAVFVETHPSPDEALCDSASMLPLSLLESLILQLKAIDQLRRSLESD